MSEFFKLKSVSDLHRMFGLGKPMHPLITIVKAWPEIDFDFENTKMTSDLYVLGMKGDVKGSFQYGRNTYDYEEGSLVFIAPEQVAKFDNVDNRADESGWSIFFHPDLFRKSELGSIIKEFSFFNYGLTESLHVSEKEKLMLTALVRKIEIELEQNIDKHSHELILVNLQSILKYCSRYYDRQFYTRTNANKDYVTRFESFLEKYFDSEDLYSKGIPTVKQCGEALNMSGSYLSDLLKLETGRSVKDHIHAYIIDRAKTILLNSNTSVGGVSYSLGFEYAQHFSKLFKSKTGFSPTEYRNMN